MCLYTAAGVSVRHIRLTPSAIKRASLSIVTFCRSYVIFIHQSEIFFFFLQTGIYLHASKNKQLSISTFRAVSFTLT